MHDKFERLDNGIADVEDFHDWCRTMSAPGKEITPWQKHNLPHILLECFPAELMAEREIGEARGLIAGVVKSYLSQPDLSAELKMWIVECRQRSKAIVMLARGGRVGVPARDVAQDLSTSCLTSRLIEDGYAVIVSDAPNRTAREVQSNIYMLPHLQCDYGLLFQEVDMVIHHGEWPV